MWVEKIASVLRTLVFLTCVDWQPKPGDHAKAFDQYNCKGHDYEARLNERVIGASSPMQAERTSRQISSIGSASTRVKSIG
jgi:hypothetical protein